MRRIRQVNGFEGVDNDFLCGVGFSHESRLYYMEPQPLNP